MGNNWAWPCSEREHKLYKHDIKTPTQEFHAVAYSGKNFDKKIQYVKYTKENAS